MTTLIVLFTLLSTRTGALDHMPVLSRHRWTGVWEMRAAVYRHRAVQRAVFSVGLIHYLDGKSALRTLLRVTRVEEIMFCLISYSMLHYTRARTWWSSYLQRNTLSQTLNTWWSVQRFVELFSSGALHFYDRHLCTMMMMMMMVMMMTCAATTTSLLAPLNGRVVVVLFHWSPFEC